MTTWITAEEAARIIGYKKNSMYLLNRDGDIRCKLVNNRLMVDNTSLKKFLYPTLHDLANDLHVTANALVYYIKKGELKCEIVRTKRRIPWDEYERFVEHYKSKSSDGRYISGDDNWLTPKEAAKYLNCRISVIHNTVLKRGVKFKKKGKFYLISKKSIEYLTWPTTRDFQKVGISQSAVDYWVSKGKISYRRGLNNCYVVSPEEFERFVEFYNSDRSDNRVSIGDGTWITPSEAADYLGLKIYTIRNAVMKQNGVKVKKKKNLCLVLKKSIEHFNWPTTADFQKNGISGSTINEWVKKGKIDFKRGLSNKYVFHPDEFERVLGIFEAKRNKMNERKNR